MRRQSRAGIVAAAMAKGLLVALSVLSSMVGGSGFAQADVTLQWSVVQPFRFFSDSRDTDLHRKVFMNLADEKRKAAIIAAERGLADGHKGGWARFLKGKTCWDADRIRNLCPKRGPYIKPHAHQVALRLRGDNQDDLAGECLWQIERLKRQQRKRRSSAKRPQRREFSHPCLHGIKIKVPFPDGVSITVSRQGEALVAGTVIVKDIFVVGLGDSFASGEGNPDVPVAFSPKRSMSYGDSKSSPDLAGYPARKGNWQRIGDQRFIEHNAKWLDQACHRSLYSHQLRVALQLAIEDPHRAVTFLGLACSGAQIVNGLFLRYKGHEWVPDPPLLSQISAVAAAQCEGHEALFRDLPEAYHIGGKIPDLQGGLQLRKCDKDKARRIDLLLVSIGGNDVGFARLVANAVLPRRSTLRMLGGWLGQVHGVREASVKMRELAARYKSFNRALHFILHIPWQEADRVLLVGYPPLALLEDGRTICPDGTAGMDVINEFYLSREKAKRSDTVARALHRAMRRAALRHKWTFVEQHRRAFLGRGICAGYADAALSSVDDLRMPRVVKGQWQPYNPAAYRPYAPRQRWFRTPNDAFLTGNFHVSAKLFRAAARQVQNLQWLQLLLAATYSGAFHPTAEGQAAIADAVIKKARKVLVRYGQGRGMVRTLFTPVTVEGSKRP